ncbi:MAG: isoprenyl transferase [Planctomycetota bacterium]|nr:isoprenyl transferase [Planctomycetota bacterium]
MDERPELEVPPHQRPRHIAVIMDGNGRWAKQRDEPRIAGHRAGARTVRDVVTECGRLEIEALTLFSFSSENWKRPADEVEALMALYRQSLIDERDELVKNKVRFMQIGRRDGLPADVLEEVDRTIEATREGEGLKLILAVNYGSRAEITDAARAIATKAQRGDLDAASIDEQMIADHLYTAGLPDPDLLIRTAGEQRISNYLLWQISYAELYVSPVYWPDFTIADLHEAIRDYARRDRRFGAVDTAR